MLQYVNSNWNAVYKLCMHIEPAPPLHYFDSLEPALVFKDEVDDADARAIFACGRPLQFYGCPRLLVSKIVEAFTALKKEPACLDMTIFALYFVGVLRPSEAWSQVYTKHLPCYACTTVETVKGKTIPRDTSRSMPGSIGWHEAVDFAVEKFHVFSQCFRKRLTVELHRRLVRGTAENEREQSCVFHKIKIRLVDEICSPQGGRSGTPNRSSATPLLLPEFASDVLGYLDRAHVGSSLLSNRGLHNLICQLKQRLPVHHLKCAFEEEMVGPGCVVRFSGAYWLEIRHLQRDLPYTNVRFFKMPSTSGAADDCALIRHYLSNSHVDNLRAPTRVPEFPFAIKMLASLKGCNVTAGRVKLSAGAERLSDYRSMDAVFGELRMGKLSFTVAEHRFVQLVKTADFFRMSAIQTLQELKLTLVCPI
ncbi:hypothetical protein AAVH_26918 [Aphelenchoides avenae]|nr:hypothetical protein AAVH_26918 [Aphelenchus avenae]